MRQPNWSILASTICCVTLVVHSRLAAADDDAAGSTISLCTATEPIRDSGLSQPATQQRMPVADQDLPPAPVSQGTDQPQSTSASELPAERAHAAPPVVNRQRMPAGFYPSESARATLNQIPGRVPIHSSPRLQSKRPGGKPFQSVQSQPTISPYLYLNAGTSNSNATTNYLAFVRPQLDQIEASRQQQREFQKLKSQVQRMSSGNTGPQSADTRNAAHYMDTAQFYRGLQR